MANRFGGHKGVMEICSVFWWLQPQKWWFLAPYIYLCYLLAHEIANTCRNMVLPRLIKLTYAWQVILGVRRTFLESWSMVFVAPAPKWAFFWPHISPFLLPAGSRNRENLLKYGVTLSNQTYLPMTGRLGGQMHVFGKLVNSF